MNLCDKAALYLYGELNETEAKEFKAHAAFCPECSKTLQLLPYIKYSVKVQDAPREAIGAIFAKTTRKEKSASIFDGFFSFSKTWKIGLAAAACLLIAILAVPKHKAGYLNYGEIYANLAAPEVTIADIENIDYALDEIEEAFSMQYA